MEHLAHIVEQHGGDKRLTALLALLFDEPVEPSDGVCLQAIHRTAPIQNEHDLR